MNENTAASVLFAMVALLVGADLLADAGSGASSFHVSTEGLGTLLAGVGAAWFAQRALHDRSEANYWRDQAQTLLARPKSGIDEQFTKWQLTEAESEVALLLLKGLSFKEIASVRDTSERTSRDQARAVYKKSSLAGRAELSAWFIEDLL